MSAESLARVERATAARQEAEVDWIASIREAVAAGEPAAAVAAVAGVSRARVSQIAPRAALAQGVPAALGTPPQAGKNVREAVRVIAEANVPTIPATPEGWWSGRASVRDRKPYGRRTAFYDTRTGRLVASTGVVLVEGQGAEAGTLAGVLAAAALAPADTLRVYLVGPAPQDTSTGATIVEAVRAWATAEPGEGWTVLGHHLGDDDLFSLRFHHDTTRQRVTVLRAAGWWGESDAGPEVCAEAWRVLTAAVEAQAPFAGAGLADTPATAGRALWLRTIPAGKSYPVLCDEVRGLIAATAGQGRIELRTEHAGQERQAFTYLDGRLMYAGLTWGMPVGEPTMWTGAAFGRLSDEDNARVLLGRGRWRVQVRVPDGWAHVGLLMAPAEGGGWCYPNTPGHTFTTWVDGSEVHLARAHGWRVIVSEGLTWREGKPLDTWKAGLEAAWRACQGHDTPAGALAARGVRSLLLFTIGAFAAREHLVTHTAPVASAPEVPAGVQVRRVGDALVWQEPGELSEFTMSTAHPEWSALVWARARARLLQAPGGGGALSLPADRVIGFATDALYLAGGDPRWPDDGKPGRFRVKGIRPGTFTWPATYTELWRLRDEAEGQTALDLKTEEETA